jgi:DNA-binding transcriptional LysR family regulator
MLVPDLSLSDLELTQSVASVHSLHEAARRLGMSPARLSKVIRRVEARIGYRLFIRTPAGMKPSPEGYEFLKVAKKVLSEAVSFPLESNRKKSKKSAEERLIGLGSISFISSYLVPLALPSLAKEHPSLRMRLVEFTHNELIAHGLAGAFDVAVHIGEMNWTKAWVSKPCGEMKWGLYGRYGHPLGLRCAEAQLSSYPFVVPIGWTDNKEFEIGEDYCPLGWSERIKGHEALSAETACEIVANSDQLTFVPELVGRSRMQRRLIQPIEVNEWSKVTQELWLSVRSDRVPNSLYRFLQSELRRILG